MLLIRAGESQKLDKQKYISLELSLCREKRSPPTLQFLLLDQMNLLLIMFVNMQFGPSLNSSQLRPFSLFQQLAVRNNSSSLNINCIEFVLLLSNVKYDLKNRCCMIFDKWHPI